MENKYANSVDFFQAKQKNVIGSVSNLILAAYELRTPENIGAIIRLAGNLGIEKVLFIQKENSFNVSKIAKVAHSSINHVNYAFCNLDEFYKIVPDDFKVVAVETSDNATNLFASVLPEKCVLVVGNERLGISQDFLNSVHQTVYIPLLGKTLSLNVSHATAIAAFEWGRQHLGLEKM